MQRLSALLVRFERPDLFPQSVNQAETHSETSSQEKTKKTSTNTSLPYEAERPSNTW